MNANKEIEQLIEKYFSGETSLEEESNSRFSFKEKIFPLNWNLTDSKY